VCRARRDLLARRAHERGLSLSALLTELAQSVTRDAIFATSRARRSVGASGPWRVHASCVASARSVPRAELERALVPILGLEAAA
jgi:hypothetical protein